jgi:molybdate transport system substrate-binding protein
MMHRAVLLAVILFCPFAAPNSASTAEIKILSPKVMNGAFSELLPQFEKSSGHMVTINYQWVGALAAHIRGGEATDVAIFPESMAEELRERGMLAAGTQTFIARAGMGVFVRKGHPRPDISSVDAVFRSVAEGSREFGLNQISEILLDPEIELVGPLPNEIQRYTRYAAGLVEGSRQEDAFNALMAFLRSPPATAVMKAKGFETH